MVESFHAPGVLALSVVRKEGEEEGGDVVDRDEVARGGRRSDWGSEVNGAGVDLDLFSKAVNGFVSRF